MSVWCRRLVEAGWLALAVLLPLWFNPFAAAPFERPKVALFHTVVAGMLLVRAGCVVRERRAARGGLRAWWGPGRPAILAALAYAGAFVLATLASVDRRSSFWGAGSRPFGALTLLALVALFLLTVETIRSRAQAERLATALLLGSVPAAVYGLAQYAGLDPLTWVARSISPAHSTLGNSVFLGAYLAMAAPFALARVASASDRRDTFRYGIVLALQVSCLAITRARGAWMGCVAGSLLLLGYLAWRNRSRAAIVAAAAMLVVGGGLFAWMNVGRIRPAVATAHGQLVGLAEIRAASGRERQAIWQATLAILPARWLLGYGPDTYAGVLRAQCPPSLARHLPRDLLVDDPHNILLEHLISAGAVGLAAYLALLAAYGHAAYRGLRSGAGGAEIAAASLSSIVAFLVYAQFNPVVIALAAFFWLDLALGVAASALQAPASQGHAARGGAAGHRPQDPAGNQGRPIRHIGSAVYGERRTAPASDRSLLKWHLA